MKNLRINKTKRKAELELNSDFYPEDVVRKSAKNFEKILKVTITKQRGKIMVTLRTKIKEADIEKIVYEFMNYVLAEVKNDMVLGCNTT